MRTGSEAFNPILESGDGHPRFTPESDVPRECPFPAQDLHRVKNPESKEPIEAHPRPRLRLRPFVLALQKVREDLVKESTLPCVDLE